MTITSYFDQVGPARFQPTPATESPWGPHQQHGGPASALLCRAIERAVAEPGLRPGRISVDILAPIPMAPLSIDINVIRQGRSTALVQATAVAEDQTILMATASCLAPAPAGFPPSTPATPPPWPPPSDTPKPLHFPFPYPDGYLSSVDWEFTRGGFDVPGAATVWTRPRIPLLAEEPTSCWQRVMIVADSCYGVAMPVDLREHQLINTDVHVSLYRDIGDPWIGIEAGVWVHPGAGAHATAQLRDTAGTAGTVTQSLLAMG